MRSQNDRFRWFLSRLKIEPVADEISFLAIDLLREAGLRGHEYAISADDTENCAASRSGSSRCDPLRSASRWILAKRGRLRPRLGYSRSCLKPHAVSGSIGREEDSASWSSAPSIRPLRTYGPESALARGSVCPRRVPTHSFRLHPRCPRRMLWRCHGAPPSSCRVIRRVPGGWCFTATACPATWTGCGL